MKWAKDSDLPSKFLLERGRKLKGRGKKYIKSVKSYIYYRGFII
jgi:hypothetical protein